MALQNITPLHLAAKADGLEVCELLLSHGAGKHAQDQAVSPVFVARVVAEYVGCCSACLADAQQSRGVMASGSLQQVDCLGVMQGDTPLHAAAQHAGAAVVKLLLDNACNPVAENLLVSHVWLCCLHPGLKLLLAQLATSAACSPCFHAHCFTRILMQPTHSFCSSVAGLLSQAGQHDGVFLAGGMLMPS